MQPFFMHQPRGDGLARVLSVVLAFVIPSAVRAQASSPFIPPEAYSIQRYEAGWNKNPFTLKTAPVLAAQVSFAKDLAIAAYYGDAEDPTVVVVNTKTGERTPLKKSQASTTGMELKSVTFGSGRKDIAAEVALGAETSELRFNDEYTKQIAAAETTKTAVGQPPITRQPGAPIPGKPPIPPGQHPKTPPPGGLPANTQLRIPVSSQGSSKGKPAIAARPLAQPARVAAKTSKPAASSTKLPPASAGQPASPPPVVVTGNTPMSSRRRLSTPSANPP